MSAARRMAGLALRTAIPVLSILTLWYATILLSGLPEFVVPTPPQVLATLVADAAYFGEHLLVTLQAALLGYLVANVVGIALAAVFVAMPLTRVLVMPSAIALRNIPYVVVITILVLALGDTLASKVTIVALAGFFPVLVNTYRGFQAVDPVILDRLHVLNAGPATTFLRVRLPFSLPYLVSAQEITGTSSIIVTIVAEWMMSSSGLGFVLNQAMAQYRGDQVYAVALLASLMSYLIYALVTRLGRRLDWNRTA